MSWSRLSSITNCFFAVYLCLRHVVDGLFDLGLTSLPSCWSSADPSCFGCSHLRCLLHPSAWSWMRHCCRFGSFRLAFLGGCCDAGSFFACSTRHHWHHCSVIGSAACSLSCFSWAGWFYCLSLPHQQLHHQSLCQRHYSIHYLQGNSNAFLLHIAVAIMYFASGFTP